MVLNLYVQNLKKLQQNFAQNIVQLKQIIMVQQYQKNNYNYGKLYLVAQQVEERKLKEFVIFIRNQKKQK